MSVLRWGIIGASTIASEWMIPAMRAAGHEAVAIYSRSPERGRRFASENGIGDRFSDLTSFLGHTEIDAVYISSTNDRHADEVRAAAWAGKHILCEKPVALSVCDAMKALRTCKELGVVFGTNHHFRNNNCARLARNLIASGEIGRPVAVRVAQTPFLPVASRGWRMNDAQGGGVIFDLTVHDADLLRFVLQDEVVAVKALSSSQGSDSHELEDSVVGVMEFEHGAIASFFDSYGAPAAENSLEIHGTTGSIIMPDALDERLIARAYLRRGDDQECLELGEPEDLYVYGLKRFGEAVDGTGAPAASGEDGLRSLAVALAVRRSAADNAHVRVRYDGDLDRR